MSYDYDMISFLLSVHSGIIRHVILITYKIYSLDITIYDVCHIYAFSKLKSAMYVANHCSWMDIPFVCRVLGFRNCKMIAKAELMKVPILGRALAVAGHVTLDRTNRKSQMQAYKSGVQWLKDGVNLVTFPEGTRSKTSRLGSFKKGAFKMAQTVGATVVPM